MHSLCRMNKSALDSKSTSTSYNVRATLNCIIGLISPVLIISGVVYSLRDELRSSEDPPALPCEAVISYLKSDE